MKLSLQHLLVGAGMALSMSPPLQAGPVPAGLSITASVRLDQATSKDPVGGASQSGSISHSRSSPGSSNFVNLPGSLSPSSLGANLLQTGDSFGASFSMSGSNPNGGTVQTDGLFTDFALNLVNSSLSETFTVLFRVDARNFVNATGRDAFAFSDLSIKDEDLNELYFTEYRVDTLNPGNNLMAESSDDSFILSLNPGQSLNISGLQRQRGGAFNDGGSSYSASLFSTITLEEVRSSGGNNQIPLPGSLALVLIGLLSGASVLRRRPHFNASSACTARERS